MEDGMGVSEESYQVGLRSAINQLETYGVQHQLETPEQRKLAMDDCLQHAVGLINWLEQERLTRERDEFENHAANKEAAITALVADLTNAERERDSYRDLVEHLTETKNGWVKKFDAAERERDEARRASDALIHLIRQHRCNCDGVMPVGECVDSGRCGCSAALLTRAISTGENHG
jgi:chromosome segregation ATPase